MTNWFEEHRASGTLMIICNRRKPHSRDLFFFLCILQRFAKSACKQSMFSFRVILVGSWELKQCQEQSGSATSSIGCTTLLQRLKHLHFFMQRIFSISLVAVLWQGVKSHNDLLSFLWNYLFVVFSDVFAFCGGRGRFKHLFATLLLQPLAASREIGFAFPLILFYKHFYNL